MRRSLLDILRCPECKGELELDVEEEDEEIEKGALYCEKCDVKYPIEDGIPNMLPQD